MDPHEFDELNDERVNEFRNTFSVVLIFIVFYFFDVEVVRFNVWSSNV